MALRGWSWDAATGPAGRGDRPLLEAVAAALPDAVVEEAIRTTGTRERRRRLLPTRLVVTLVVAMGLWAADAVRHVLATVVEGWREQASAAQAAWWLPSNAAIVRARQRTEARVLRAIFHAGAAPIATPATPAAFLGGLRLMAAGGTTLDVADTPANARAFGRPTTRRGDGAFPQLRVVALIETGSHALCAVVLRPFRCGEAPAGRQLLRAVHPGMLLLWDRGFDGYQMVHQTLARGAHFLGRTRANVVLTPTAVRADGSYRACISPSPPARRRRQDGITVRVVAYTLDTPAGPGRERYRLITSLLDANAFPAAQLATTYHERWEVATTLDEVKVHQWAHPRPLRSQRPREVVQELSGLLLAPLAIRTRMYQAAVQDGIDPDRLSFTGALRVLRRAIPRAQRTAPPDLPLFATSSSPTLPPNGCRRVDGGAIPASSSAR